MFASLFIYMRFIMLAFQKIIFDNEYFISVLLDEFIDRIDNEEGYKDKLGIDKIKHIYIVYGFYQTKIDYNSIKPNLSVAFSISQMLSYYGNDSSCIDYHAKINSFDLYRQLTNSLQRCRLF